MKSKSLYLLLVGCMALFMASCGSDDEKTEITATGINLDMNELQLPAETTETLVATLTPEGATGEIVWSSSDPSIAAINKGVITALSKGSATIVASYGAYSATCDVTVTAKVIDPALLPESLKGSDYYIIQIDETSYAQIQSKVLEDMRPDDIEGSKNLFVWENTFDAGTPAGLNFYGQAEGWISFVVGSVGWSGAGYNVGATYDGTMDLTNMFNHPEDYYLHIGFKSSQPSTSFLFILGDGTSEAKICIGSQDYVDGGTTFAAYADFARDNEWHSVEIPVSHLNTLGVFYNEPFKDANVFAFLGGGVAGTTLDMDAIFFYKKAK